MSNLQKKRHSVWADPRVWVLLVAFGLFIVIARSFFMGDAAQKTPEKKLAVFIFFRQEVKPAEMPSLLKSFGAEGCTNIGGGTHVFQCTESSDPQGVLQKAKRSDVVFDAMTEQTTY